jgi:hypothetical protein
MLTISVPACLELLTDWITGSAIAGEQATSAHPKADRRTLQSLMVNIFRKAFMELSPGVGSS